MILRTQSTQNFPRWNFHLAWQTLRQSMWTFLIKKNIPHHSSSFASHPPHFLHILPICRYSICCFLFIIAFAFGKATAVLAHFAHRFDYDRCIGGWFAFKLNRQIIRIVIMIFISFITIIIVYVCVSCCCCFSVQSVHRYIKTFALAGAVVAIVTSWLSLCCYCFCTPLLLVHLIRVLFIITHPHSSMSWFTMVHIRIMR